MPKGYVYILTNPSFSGNWVKIGKTNRPVDVRSKELDNTAVPLPYEVFAVLETEKFVEAEKHIHKQIDKLTDLRIRKTREFFNIPPEKIASIFEDIADLLGEDARVIYYKDGKVLEQKPKETQKKSTQSSQTSSHTEHLKKGNDDIKECLEHLRNLILRIDETVEEIPRKSHISYKKNKRCFAGIEVRKDKLHLYLQIDPKKIETLRNGENMTQGHSCNGRNAKITINNMREVVESKEYIKEAFGNIEKI